MQDYYLAQINVARMKAPLANQFPSAAESRERIEHLTLHGESSKCFTFGKLYPAPKISYVASVGEVEE